MAKPSKQAMAAYIKKLDYRKNRLMELSGENVNSAFAHVRALHGQQPADGKDLLAAYDTVIELFEKEPTK